jgi:hypothetical protein
MNFAKIERSKVGKERLIDKIVINAEVEGVGS